MLDLSHIPNSQQDIKIYYANSGSLAYQTWQKPRKCNYIFILSIDGAAGGSSGTSAQLFNSAGSTPGGGSGAITRALINSNLVPDTLYIKVGKGGLGGASASGSTNNTNVGGSGESSGVFVLSQLNSQANAAQAVSLLGGAVSAVPGAGTAASSLANNYLIGLTNFISLAGSQSLAGLYTPLTYPVLNSHLLTGGGLGGGINTQFSASDGGGFFSSSISPLIAGGLQGTTLGSDGANGYTSWKPFFSIGGAGGGSTSTPGGQAGNGGNGGIGSGGGSGGSAYSGTSGKGGNGGDGLVVIISF
jgi:hypothetical protein